MKFPSYSLTYLMSAGIFLAPQPSPSAAQSSRSADFTPSECKAAIMPDNTQVLMCKDGNGRWQANDSPEQVLNNDHLNSLPNRAEVTYQGSWSALVRKSASLSLNSFSIGSVLNQAINDQVKRFGGEFHITATISGSRLTAIAWGHDFSKTEYVGTIESGICKMSGSSGGGQSQFEGKCNKNFFSGILKGVTPYGNKYSADIQTSIVQIIDIQKREQEQLASQKSREVQLAAAAAKLRAAPSAGPVLTRKLDGLVLTDSRGWAFNKYQAGSMTNVKIVEGSIKSGHYVLRGEYEFNGGSTGWVIAKMSGQKLDCIQFHDSVVGCRGLRSAAQGQAMRQAAVGALFSDGGSNDDRCDSNCQNNREMQDSVHQRQQELGQIPK